LAIAPVYDRVSPLEILMVEAANIADMIDSLNARIVAIRDSL
jgi:hypothetical protein